MNYFRVFIYVLLFSIAACSSEKSELADAVGDAVEKVAVTELNEKVVEEDKTDDKPVKEEVKKVESEEEEEDEEENCD